jgi:hypothetical protein
MWRLFVLFLLFTSSVASASEGFSYLPPQQKEDADRSPTSVNYVEREWQPASLSRPNALSLEAAGRGLLYSVNYDRSIGENASIGAGFGYLDFSGVDVSTKVMFVPAYLNVYLASNHHRPFLTGGVTIIHIDGQVGGTVLEDKFEASATTAMPMFGLGYEYRSDFGFLFRVSPYVMVTPLVVIPWAGVSLGATF